MVIFDFPKFLYGEDGLDPAQIEDQDKPVVLERLLKIVQAIYPYNRRTDKYLLPFEIIELANQKLAEGCKLTQKDVISTIFLDEIKFFFQKLSNRIGKGIKKKYYLRRRNKSKIHIYF